MTGSFGEDTQLNSTLTKDAEVRCDELVRIITDIYQAAIEIELRYNIIFCSAAALVHLVYRRRRVQFRCES